MPFSGLIDVDSAAALDKREASYAEEPVRLLVKGTSYHDWFEIDIDSNVFTPADAFHVSARNPDKSLLGVFREGASCDVYVGDDRQMAGVIDDVEIKGEKDATRMTLSGRDKGAYLTDSDAKAEHFSNYSIRKLAEHLLQSDWGIKKVITSNEDNRKVQLGKKEKAHFREGERNPKEYADGTRKETKIDPGQKVSQILDEHTRRLGVTWWMTAQGDLFIGKPQYKQEPVFDFSCRLGKNGQDNNILPGWSVKRSIAERYKEIVCVGQAGAGWDATTDTAKHDHKFKGVATDPDLSSRGINRRLILMDNDALNSGQCKAKADEEMQKRRLQGLIINITVGGFKNNGRLITTDCLANLKIEEAGIDGVFWIAQRRFTENNRERRTTITLHEKGVYLP